MKRNIPIQVNFTLKLLSRCVFQFNIAIQLWQLSERRSRRRVPEIELA